MDPFFFQSCGNEHSRHLPCLGRQILKGEVSWNNLLPFTGEFHFITGYWEWCEDVLSRCQHALERANIYDVVYASLFTYDRDTSLLQAFCEAWCPLTNTLLTSQGELSISLWDLHTIAGLPIAGLIYEEAIPDTMELTGGNDKGHKYLPLTCKTLFEFYHLLQKENNGKPTVSVTKWVEFWSKKTVTHKPPPPRKERKPVKTRPRATHNPTGVINNVAKWTSKDDSFFAKLGLKDHKREEAYLATFLSCWLCAFVLPTKEGDFIRPGTFKVASRLATGRRIGLAVPVLTSIYRGLNRISTCSQLDASISCFPAHFVYGWLACYFATHYTTSHALTTSIMTAYSGEGGAKYFDGIDARKRIFKGDAAWISTAPERSSPTRFHDLENTPESDLSYFMSLRSNYLALRDELRFIIEPYSPHRFSRQFGFFQDRPACLLRDIRSASLEEGLLFARLCVMSNSKSHATFPPITSNMKKSYNSMKTYCSSAYTSWWGKVHGSCLDDNLQTLATKAVLMTEPLGDTHREESNEVVVLDIPPISKAKSTKLTKGKAIKHQATVRVPQEETCIQEHQGDTETLFLEEQEEATKSPHKRVLEENDGSSNGDICWKHKKSRLEEEEVAPGVSVGDAPDIESSPKSLAILKEKPIGAEPGIAEIEQEMSSAGHAKSASHSSRTPTALPNACKSVFKGKSVILKRKKTYIYGLWEEVCSRLSEIDLESITQFEEEIKDIFDEIDGLGITNLSPLKGLVDSLFGLAASYDHGRSESADKMSETKKLSILSDIQQRIQSLKSEEAEKDGVVSSKQKLIGITERKLKRLRQEFGVAQEELAEIKAKISAAEDELSSYDGVDVLSTNDIAILDEKRKSLEASRQALIDYKLCLN